MKADLMLFNIKKPKEKALAGRGSAGELPERESWQLFFFAIW